MRKLCQVERDFALLKSKHAKQQTQLEQSLHKQHELMRGHESDMQLLVRSEEIIRKLQIQNNKTEKKMFKQ